jgi:hypothetical protein
MIEPELRPWLHRILDAVRAFGSAHDARDRGYDAEADRIDREETQVVRELCTRSASLPRLLPELWSLVAAGQPLADRGFEIAAEVRAALRQLDGGLSN